MLLGVLWILFIQYTDFTLNLARIMCASIVKTGKFSSLGITSLISHLINDVLARSKTEYRHN